MRVVSAAVLQRGVEAELPIPHKPLAPKLQAGGNNLHMPLAERIIHNVLVFLYLSQEADSCSRQPEFAVVS